MIDLGCLADDYTGGTDVAVALRRAGLRTVLLFGEPSAVQPLPECDAVVVALKTRTIPAADAVAMSLRVQKRFAAWGVRQTYFKYCSTFDSTDEGNIGPVTDALVDAAGAALTLICPASPEHGRTTYRGHHFVGDALLSESSMRHHPLTPMPDPNLVRVLSRQTPQPVGLLGLDVVRAGSAGVGTRLAELADDGVRHVVVDATCDADLATVAQAARSVPVLTGGAGLAGALASTISGTISGTGGEATPVAATTDLPAGPGLVLAGSCSAATLGQVAFAAERFPSLRLDPAATPDPAELLTDATAWLEKHLGHGPVLIYSSAGPEQRAAARAAMGAEVAEHLERILGELARTAVGLGVRRVVVAGGETSGAVVGALDVRTVVVTAEEDHGLPWCVTTTAEPQVGLLLKSGNFGRPDLLVRAVEGVAP
jgi:uncharacterized protein YgbK (DUF1537 family)